MSKINSARAMVYKVAAPLERHVRIPKAFVALRHRNFRLYIAGQLISSVGSWMQIIAQGWLIYQLTHSERALGLVGFASAIPALLVTPWAGVVIDRADKRKLLLITQFFAMLSALVLASLTFSGIVQVWHVIVLAIMLGTVNAFDAPARQAFVVDMVGHEDMPNAIALNSMTFNSARIIGPAVGGILLATLGASWCFLLNGVSFIASILSLFWMRLASHDPDQPPTSPWTQFKSGVIYVHRLPEVRGILLMALCFSLFGISYSTVLPAFVDKVLHRQAGAFGALNAMAGIGAVTGALLIASYGERVQRGRWLTVDALVFPLVLILFALNRNYTIALLLAILLGIGFMVQFTLLNTLLQTRISDEMRGRVLSLYTLTFFGFTPFGNLAIGMVAQSWGLSFAIVLSALFWSVAAAIILWKTPQVRQLA